MIEQAPLPLVSILVPLYRASRFVDALAVTIEAIDYPNLEVIFSDRHQHDDALTLLRDRLGQRDGVEFIAADDELTWFENYNFLLRAASGKYVRLLAQDDRIPPASVTAGVIALEADPDAAVVIGPVDTVDADGRLVLAGGRGGDNPARGLPGALAVFSGRRRGAMLGLIRRDVLVRHDLFLEPTAQHSGLSSAAWLFSLALRGSFVYAPDYRNQRGVHPDSFTARHWGRSRSEELERLWSYYRLGLRIWNRRYHHPAARAAGVPLLFSAGVVLLPARRIGGRLRPGTRTLISRGGRVGR